MVKSLQVKTWIYWIPLIALCLLSQSLHAAICTTGLINGLQGSYFNNKTLTGTATGTRTDNNVNFDWGSGSPGVAGVGSNSFSVRWSGNLRAPATGPFQFQTVSDDGVRLWVNGQLVIDNWTDHSSTTNTSASVNLVAGNAYAVVLEYYENGGSAIMKLLWRPPTDSSFSVIDTQTGVTADTSSYCSVPIAACDNGYIGGVTGKYYANKTLSGSPATTQLDSIINYDWSTGSTGVSGLGADNFSIRWDGTFKVNTTGNYQFQTTSDDGIRVWINNVLVIDNWTDHSVATNTSASIALTAGVAYPVRLEFYENGGYAVVSLSWKKPSDSGYVPINSCPATVSYYGIAHAGTGITCAAEPITISAYDATGALVIPTAGTQVNLTTSPNTGTWVGGASYTFSGTEKSFIKYLQQTTPATLNINLSDGTFTESSSLDPSLTFADTALKFYGSATSSVMPTEIAGQLDANPILKALRTDTNTGACVARVTGTKAVSLGFECNNPTSCVAGQTLTLAGNSVQSNANGAVIAYSSANLTFDSSGAASIPFKYTDVGQIKLYAKLGLAASGNDPLITLIGSSNSFVVKPYTLAVSAVQTLSGVANPSGTNLAGSAYGFVSAGTPFQVSIEARNFTGARTPNFGKETSSENNILLNNLQISYPSGGTQTPLSNATGFTASSPAGTFINSNILWNQVGSFTVDPRLADNDYLAAGDIPYVTTSPKIGRIYPDHFRLVSASTTQSCSSFTYMGQAFPAAFSLQAETLGNQLVSNYGASYSTAAVSLVAENGNDGQGVVQALGGRLTLNPSPVWSAGTYTFSGTASFARKSTAYAPDGPFTSLQMGMKVIDTFDLRSLQSLDMNDATTGACAGSCTAKALGSALNLRYGRLRLDSAFGPETAPLPVNFVTEYWTGNYFALNTADSCTLVPRSAITYPAGSLTNDANRTVTLSGGSTQGSYLLADASNIHINAGTAGQVFSAPTANAQGSFIVKTDLASLNWLTYDWDQNGVYDDTKLPNATFTFGSYRGNDRLIYWREKLQ